ncbi:MAG: hypothetical protein Q7S29_01380 [Candidatus Peribacter sp.]|nr:hypothetical protein [Candidatus Peribacter sp.]
MDPLLPSIAWSAVILLLEGILWALFQRRFSQIGLPPSDRTFFHLFTIGRMRLFILFHAIVLCSLAFVTHFLLWA